MTTPHTYEASAHCEEGGWWTIDVPELTSPGPDGTTIIATGSATTVRGLDQSARELVAVWLDVEASDVNVHVSVKVPDDVVRAQGAEAGRGQPTGRRLAGTSGVATGADEELADAIIASHRRSRRRTVVAPGSELAT